MPARPVLRAVAAAALLALGPGCSGAPLAPASSEAALCAPDQLDACARRLTASPAGPAARPLAAAYAAARAIRDPADPWTRLFHELDAADRGPRAKAVLLVEGGAAPAAAAGVRAVTLASALPAPGAADADDLLLALSAALGYQQVVRVHGTAVTQLFPGDPLAPFMGGLRPALRGEASLAHLRADLDAEDALRAALTAASALRYGEAALAADKLSALLEGRDASDEVALRGRYALQLLGAAGLMLDAEESATPAPATEAAPAAAPAEPAPLGPDDTPYASYLRVVSAKDSRKEWEVRGTRVLAGIAADRRDDFAAMFVRPRDCGARRAPPIEGPRDLVFANKLSISLQRDLAAPLAAGQLPLRAWLERYEKLVRLVDESGTAWSYLPSLLYQRGELGGLTAAGTATYRRVTALGLAHLAALAAVEEAYPVRYRSFTQLGIALSPGALGDEKLREALLRLNASSVHHKLAAAKDAEGLLMALAVGIANGLAYPPALQESHFLAVAGAATARLKGDFLQKTGWGVAALYALDAVYRVATSQGPSLSFSSAQIARALAAKDVEHQAVASLATAAARYAALAGEKKLDPSTAPDKLPPERRAARAELVAALAGLGAPGEAPASVLDDTATLTDGLIATLSSAIAAGLAPKPAAKPGACAAKTSAAPLDPALRRSLARLGDVRRRILLHPAYKQGDGLWVRRVRLLVTVLSDAMDLAIASDTKKAPAFSVTAAEAEKIVGDALREIDNKAVADVVAGGYGLFRRVAATGNAEEFLAKSGKDLRKVASGLITLFRGDTLGGKGPAMGVALLDALSGMRFEAPKSDDLVASLISYAGAFYDRKQPDQGDFCLLAALVVTSLSHAPPPAAIRELAEKNASRVAWLIRFSEEVHKTGRMPDPAVYAEGMRKATDDACQAPDAEATIAVMRAIHAFTKGDRKEARQELDRVLESAEDKGLGVPRMTYKYEEKTKTKVFTVAVDISYGSGLLSAGNTFQLGLGFRTTGEPEGSLTASLAPLDTPKAQDDTARYYVYAAGLATVYHLLEGDAERATASGRRVVAALSSGLKLGPRVVRGEKPGKWGDDARYVLIVAAQLAAEAGHPFLAGDLWTLVRQGLGSTLDDKAVDAMLDEAPTGIAGIDDLKPVIARAKRSLKVLAAPLPCTEAKVEVGGFEEVSCADYPLALSLRIADALKKLPRLHRGPETSAHCAPLRSLDAFLGPADKGTYDPDAFTRAVEDLRADGKVYEAATLLARHKHPNHCSPAIVSAARALGGAQMLGPWLRVDLRTAAVNCTAAAGGPEVEADLAAIDDDTKKLPDPTRNLRMVLSIADLAARTDQWGLLTRLVQKPDFVGRWLDIHPNAAAAALLLDHAVAAIDGQPVALERTRGAYELYCTVFKAPERDEICGMIEVLRKPLEGPLAERQRFAREAVKKLVARAAAPPKP